MATRASRSPARKSPASPERIRIEVYHTARPAKRILLSIAAATTTLDALHDAIAARLHVRPERCCLGESQVEVVSPADLRDGDTLRVLGALPPAADGADSGAAPGWRGVVKTVLTAMIFIALFESYQHWVHVPFFRPDLSNYLLGERVPDDE